jgi:hypothetical protein
MTGPFEHGNEFFLIPKEVGSFKIRSVTLYPGPVELSMSVPLTVRI